MASATYEFVMIGGERPAAKCTDCGAHGFGSRGQALRHTSRCDFAPRQSVDLPADPDALRGWIERTNATASAPAPETVAETAAGARRAFLIRAAKRGDLRAHATQEEIDSLVTSHEISESDAMNQDM